MGDVMSMHAFLVLGKQMPNSRSLRSRRNVLSLGRVVADEEATVTLSSWCPRSSRVSEVDPV